MSRWGMFLLGAAIALVVVVTAFLWIDRMTPVTVVVEPIPTQAIRVSISGAVASPGVVSVPPDARLADVAEAAGGFSADADYSALNLAGRVGDGDQIVVPSINPTAAGGQEHPLSVRATGDPVLNINSASLQELDELPGIGEVLAGRIIDYRDANGAFSSVDDLVRVEGISARMVEELRPLITVGDDR